MSDARPKMPLAITGWIVLCAFCTCTGWVLSACHQLNARGYAVAFSLAAVAAVLLRRRLFTGGFPRWKKRKLLRRFRRPFSLAFLIMAFLAILGGVLYAPNNYDG